MHHLSERALAADTVGLLEGLCTTRAIRRYAPDPVPEDVLRDILFAATRAPSGSNRQPFRFIVLQDGPKAREAKRLMGDAARAMWRYKEEHDGYTRGSGTVDNSPKSRMARVMAEYVEHFEQTPVVVLPCLIRYRGPSSSEGGSVYPACQNLLLAARALGYGGVLTGFHHAVEDELQALLDIPEGVFIAATITLGRPLGNHGTVRRRPIEEMVFEEGWGESAPWAHDPPGTRFTSAGPPGAPTERVPPKPQ